MKKIGVRMINIDFYPLLGGAQMHTLRLSRYLRVNGVDVEVITRSGPGLASYDEIDGVPVYRTPILNASKAGASLSFTAYALRHLAAERADFQILHCHEMISPMTIGLLGSQLLGKRLVINPHRGGYLGDMFKLTTRRKTTGRLRLGWACRRGDAFISVSKEISAELRAGGVAAEKIHFIPYALDTRHFHPAPPEIRAGLRERLRLAGDLWACYTGRLVEEKGLDLLLHAWGSVVRETPQAHLLIVGDGDQRARLETLARELDLGASVQFTGAVEDTAPYLQACDLYVQPSYTEGLPISMLEAMACGLPVLATAVGGVGDLLRDHHSGVIIPAHDVESLRAGLLELLHNPGLRCQLGAVARQDVVDYCAIEKIGQAHLALYESLLAQNGGRK